MVLSVGVLIRAGFGGEQTFLVGGLQPLSESGLQAGGILFSETSSEVSFWAQGLLTRRLSVATQEAEAECEFQPRQKSDTTDRLGQPYSH